MNRLVIVALFGLVAVAVARPCGPKPTPAGRQGDDDDHECPWKAEGLRQLGKYFQGKELETVYEHVEGFALEGGCPMLPMGEEPPTREEVEEGVNACLEAAYDYFKGHIDEYPVLKAIFEKHADASCGGHDEDDGEEEARCGEESDEARDDDESDEARCGEESDEARDDDESDEARCGGYDVESDEARDDSDDSDEARCGEESDEARDDSDDSDEARCGEESDEARDDDESDEARCGEESDEARDDSDDSDEARCDDESDGDDDESEDAGSDDEDAEERCGGSPPPRRAGSPPPRRQ